MTVAARSHPTDEPSQALNARKRRSAPKKGRRVLRLRNVSLRNQHDHLVLNSVSASFIRGTLSAILTGYRDLPWPPAQEPSPFLLACAGLTPLAGGRVSWPRPRSIAARFRGDLEPIGYVPRRCALNDELTVEQELMLALAATGRFADHQAMLSLCQILVLTPLLNAQVALLTPFERLRTAIARALITGTPLLLVEEPTEFLSAEESEDLFGHFFELTDMGYSIIVATRSPEVAAQSDQALILIDGEVVGNISQPDYHALNLAFSTALKNPQTSAPMTWVSRPDDGVVTIDDDELLESDFGDESDEDNEPSMHPTWVPVVPSPRDRQLRPIPLALPPVSSSTPSAGVPTAANSSSTPAASHGGSPPGSSSRSASMGASLGAAASVPSAANPTALGRSAEDANKEGLAASASIPVPPIPTTLPPAPTARPHDSLGIFAAHSKSEAAGSSDSAEHVEIADYEISLPAPVSHTQDNTYPSTTMLPQIPRPTTGPLSEDSTAVLNRAQQILTELPGPVLPLVNKDRQSK